METLEPGVGEIPHPDPAKLSFDLDRVLNAVATLRSQAPEDAFSSSYLGTERRGSAVLVDADESLFLTIGYLVTEADSITLTMANGNKVPAHLIAYDYPTGYALIRSTEKMDATPIEMGQSADIEEGQKVIVAPGGGTVTAMEARVASKREFAGYWEYLLDYAIFTTPPHPYWSGAALIDGDGRLAGIGSLFVQDAASEGKELPGNMFVPIDLLKPEFEHLRTRGASSKAPRPWLGMYAMEAKDSLFITSLTPDGPAEEAGVEPGDMILGVGDRTVTSLSDCYRKIWATGSAGVEIVLHLQRDEDSLTVHIESTDRQSFMKQPRRH